MKSHLPTRRLIPKWRPIAAALQTPDVTPVPVVTPAPLLGGEDEFQRALAQWQETKSPGALGDLLAFGVVRDMADRVAEVGYTALKAGDPVTPVQSLMIKDIAHHQGLLPLPFQGAISTDDNRHPFQVPIQAVRALLKTAPNNALALLDYAQFQLAIGRPHKAERAIRTALALRPDNRLVLRTAARYLVHVGQPDQGHQLIRRHARTVHDPWLMASEIALADAAQVPSQNLAKAKRFLFDQKKMAACHLTELAGAVSMAELSSGSLKRARETQRQALLAPNDNVIAQAFELRTKLGLHLDGVTIERAIAASSEARVLRAWSDADLGEVSNQAFLWHVQEPFSSRPVQILSTLAAYEGKQEAALRWIRAGLIADPNDQGLLINLAYVLVLNRDYTEATNLIRKLRATKRPEVEPFAVATEGLLAYQHGHFEAGDLRYNAAISFLDKVHMPQIAAYCRLNQAFAACDNSHPGAQALMAKAQDALKTNMSPDSAVLLKARDQLPLEAPTNDEPAGRRLSQWFFDPATNTLTQQSGVTNVGAKAIVVRSPDDKKPASPATTAAWGAKKLPRP